MTKLRKKDFNREKLRPFIGADGKSYYRSKDGPVPSEAMAKLTPQEWDKADEIVEVEFAVHSPLTTWLVDKGLFVDIEGISHGNLYEYTGVEKSADGLKPVVYGLPLCYTHADIRDAKQEILLKIVAKRVAEKVEVTVLGVDSNRYPSLWGLYECLGMVEVDSVNEGLNKLKEGGFYGPYIVVHGEAMSSEEVQKWQDDERTIKVLKSPHLQPLSRIVFQASLDTIRIIVGLRPTLVQWDDCFKVVTIMVPDIRTDSEGRAGVAVRSEASRSMFYETR